MDIGGSSWSGLWGSSHRTPTNSRTVNMVLLIINITFKQNNCSWIIGLMPWAYNGGNLYPYLQGDGSLTYPALAFNMHWTWGPTNGVHASRPGLQGHQTTKHDLTQSGSKYTSIMTKEKHCFMFFVWCGLKSVPIFMTKVLGTSEYFRIWKRLRITET